MRSVRVLPLLFLLLATLPWWGGLGVEEFVWDDTYLIEQNPSLASPRILLTAFTRPWADGSTHDYGRAKNAGYYRPIATLSLALDRAIWGPNPVGYRVGSLIIHGGVALLLLLVLVGGAGVSRPWALALALLYAWHPVQSEVLAVAAYRTSLLEALFGLAAVAMLTPPGGRQPSSGGLMPPPERVALSPLRGVLLLVFFLLALMSKEGAITLVLALPLMAWGLRGRAWLRANLYWFLGLAGLAAAFWGVRALVVQPSPGAVLAGLSLGERVLVFLGSVPRYLVMLFWPVRLNPHYDISLFYPPLVSWSTWFGVGVLGLLLALVGVGLRRGRAWVGPLLAALAIMAPYVGLVPLRVLAAERFLYLSLAFLLVAGGLVNRAGLEGSRQRLLRVLSRLLIVCILVCGVRSLVRTADWRSNQAIMEATAADWPESLDAHLSLGEYLLQDGDRAGARQEAEEALRIYPGFPPAKDLLDRASSGN